MKGTRWRWMGWLRARRGLRTKIILLTTSLFCLLSLFFCNGFIFFVVYLMLLLFVKERECRSCEE
jgi:hypothetical protein